MVRLEHDRLRAAHPAQDLGAGLPEVRGRGDDAPVARDPDAVGRGIVGDLEKGNPQVSDRDLLPGRGSLGPHGNVFGACQHPRRRKHGDAPVPEQGRGPAGVVRVVVRKQDGVDAAEVPADAGQQVLEPAAREASVYEEAPTPALHVGGVAGAAARKYAQTQACYLLSVGDRTEKS